MTDRRKAPGNKTTARDLACSNHRRESRVALSIEVEVSGIDRKGLPFCECTKTFDVSEWGCSFYLPFDLGKDALVALRVLGTQPYCLVSAQPVMFQVTYSKPEVSSWRVGASKIQPEKLWNLDAVGDIAEKLQKTKSVKYKKSEHV